MWKLKQTLWYHNSFALEDHHYQYPSHGGTISQQSHPEQDVRQPNPLLARFSQGTLHIKGENHSYKSCMAVFSLICSFTSTRRAFINSTYSFTMFYKTYGKGSLQVGILHL